MKNELKNKHMELTDRIDIEECLVKGMTFKAIARRIGKSATTVSREVKGHLKIHKNGFVKTDKQCPKLLKAPFVCNGCDKRRKSSCVFARQLYIGKHAQTEYESLLVEARIGIPLSKESFYETEKIISDAVKRGQHIYHAIQANDLPVSTATVYRHIKKGYYTISALDLPRMVSFKPRRCHATEFVPFQARQGRRYENYLTFRDENPDIPVVEFDTVIGRVGGKVIMTIHFVSCDFMAGILLENKTAAHAAQKISELKTNLENQGFPFSSIIPLILTDNGGEFSSVSSFENDSFGKQETRMFFCDSNASYQKPHIEKNHTLFRNIAPKGSSFDDFSQDTVNLIFSHVNAVKRNQFHGKSSYDLFVFTHSSALAEALGISFVSAKDVIQSPKLLR